MKRKHREGKRVILFFPELLKNQQPLHVPLELITLVPGLKSLGLEVQVLDERIESWSEESLQELLKDVVFVGTGSRPGGQVARSFAFAKAVRKVAPEVPVVMGGWFPSIIPERVAAHPAVDFVITGEGEIPISQVAQALLTGQDVSGIQGLAYFTDGQFHHVPHERKSRITEYAMPDYSVLNIERYMGPVRELAYISSKGCRGNCTFCAIQCGYSTEWFALPAERVLAEIIRLVEEYSLAKIRFVDANFFTDETRVAAICKGILESGHAIKWQAPGRLDQLADYTEQTWALMQQSGCHAIEVGVESGSEGVICAMKKEESKAQLDTLLRRLEQWGIAGTFNYILGYPAEAEEDLKATLNEIMAIWQRYEFATFAIYRFSPIPITDLYKELLGAVPGAEDPELVEHFKIYRCEADQPWLNKSHQRIIDMLFYFYLPYALRRSALNRPGLLNRVKQGLVNLARSRVKHFNFIFPFEWWLLRLGTRAGLLNPQRFRQWAQS